MESDSSEDTNGCLDLDLVPLSYVSSALQGSTSSIIRNPEVT